MKVLSKNVFMVLTLTLSLFVVSCSSTSEKKDDGSSDSDTMVTDNTDATNMELNGSSDESTAGPLRTIYFDYNSSSLSFAAREALEANAEFLKLSGNIAIQIEGHADERGGVQYNIALGEKRAQSVRDYLTALGVSAERVTTVSYGKDRPLAFGHDDQAWSKNRRANFVITAN